MSWRAPTVLGLLWAGGVYTYTEVGSVWKHISARFEAVLALCYMKPGGYRRIITPARVILKKGNGHGGSPATKRARRAHRRAAPFTGRAPRRESAPARPLLVQRAQPN